MSSVVQFLEALARNPKPMSAEDLTTAVANTAFDPAIQRAILDQDAASLSDALGGRTTMLCFIAPAENDEPQKDNDQDDQNDEENPPSEPASRAA